MIIVDEFWMANLKEPKDGTYLGCADWEVTGIGHFDCPQNGIQYENKIDLVNFIAKHKLNLKDYEIQKYTLIRNN